MVLARLTVTVAAMASVALALAALSPPTAELISACTAPQRLADTAGPDTVVLCGAAVLAWLAWGWGALGLLLTAVGALPGWVGAVARVVGRVVLPAGARRAAAVALGLSLGFAGPPAGLALAAPPAPAGAVAGPVVPDWPAAAPVAPPAPVPDGPAPPPLGTHVVARGDCLWLIAARALRSSGHRPSEGEVATAVHAWWSANAAVVGPDPDLLLPGQVLHPPQETR
jgi:nucleoid-associated protein YgaU